MIIDARTIDVTQPLEADICIIGSGPAGITLARELSSTQSLKICLLESGDREFDPAIQALYEGELDSKSGYPQNELTAGRCRQLGGSANFWEIQIDDEDVAKNIFNVRHVIPDEIDFQKRDAIPHSGWPFERSELIPYYERAQKICKIGPLSYDAKDWETADRPQLNLSAQGIESRIFQFGPRAAFAHDYIEELRNTPNVNIYTYANAVELLTHSDGQVVEKVRVVTSIDQGFLVKAKTFILATGGMENARLLLLSDSVHTSGIGNRKDLVGRFYMDHPAFNFGILKPKNSSLFNKMGLYDLHRAQGTAAMARLIFSEETLRKEQLLNIGLALVPQIKGIETQSVMFFRQFTQSLRNRNLSSKTFAYLQKSLSNAGEVTSYLRFRALKLKQPIYNTMRGGWSSLPHNNKRFFAFYIAAQTEQTPSPDNRISLSNIKDDLGYPRTKLTWTWQQSDINSINRSQELLRQAVTQSNLGEFQPQFELSMGARPYIASPHHHLGTTRMHDSPHQGVVDRHCRVHGVANLFIAGSSVFPTGLGYANPTLTIIALATRLSDHIKKQFSL
ncbi:GMC family oxidoreductase [Leptothoe sp. PORK10 BA2]|uniref:GMC family oxidoreductase n=1 Tax=Leptothoe sp. PORK10 BA2 TaxID=3110254 RepID=UPI002B205C15|nr:GMC family oxidoreductase [Leptothoe sp. PORK10 BA2]MEA5463858.1 GMC family oxidoreductase [Leptothoe sp. PORK10 BA2]